MVTRQNEALLVYTFVQDFRVYEYTLVYHRTRTLVYRTRLDLGFFSWQKLGLTTYGSSECNRDSRFEI